MKVRLIHCGPKKIAVIKEIRAAYGINLKDAKNWADKAPCNLPNPPTQDKGMTLVHGLRLAGAKIEAQLEATAIDMITASSYIGTAQVAIGEGNLRECRNSLRSALRLIGDWDEMNADVNLT